MLNISDEAKELYKQNKIHKTLVVNFSDLSLTIPHSQIVGQSLKIKEGLCEDTDIKYGSCISSEVSIVVADVTDDLKGQVFTLTQLIGEYTIPLGRYQVDSVEKQDDLRFKNLVAYDFMQKINTDVSSWYNSLFSTGTETYTLAQFRASFLAYVGLTEDVSKLPLPNDSMVVEHTLDNPANLSGRTVIEAIEEVNGCFGHINREGNFTHVFLDSSYGLYPSETLYPSEDLYPEEGAVLVGKAQYESVKFEEYTVNPIDKLQIRQEEGDIGITSGTGNNAYIVTGNFLLYGKGSAELQVIADNLYNVISGIQYRPFTSKSIGLPYVEVGDAIGIEQNDYIVSYVLQRTLTGIQALKDEYTAEGSEERVQTFGLSYEIEQLKGKSAKIVRTVDEVSSTLIDLATNTESSITQLSNEIELKVSESGVIAAINVSPEEIKLDANRIELTGYVTITSLETPGSVEIDGGNLKAGTVVADSVSSNWVYAGNINAGQITAGEFSGDRINGGVITGAKIYSVFDWYGDTVTIGMEEVGFSIDVVASGVNAHAGLNHDKLLFGVDGQTQAIYGKNNMSVSSVSCQTCTINGYEALTPNSYTMQLIMAELVDLGTRVSALENP